MIREDEDIDPRVLWPIDMTPVTDPFEDEDMILVTELVWDSDSPFVVMMNQYEHGGHGDDITRVVTFDHFLIARVLETHQEIDGRDVRFTPQRMNPHQPPSADTMWITITVRPNRPDPEVFYIPRTSLLAFMKAISERIRNEDADLQDWNPGLMALLGGAP